MNSTICFQLKNVQVGEMNDLIDTEMQRELPIQLNHITGDGKRLEKAYKVNFHPEAVS